MVTTRKQCFTLGFWGMPSIPEEGEITLKSVPSDLQKDSTK